eukprot:965825_1
MDFEIRWQQKTKSCHSAAKEFNNNKLIKLIFHHQCRGDANYDKDDGCVNKQRTGNRTKNTYARVRTKSSDGAVNTYRSIEMSSITNVHTNDTMEEEEEKYQDNNGCVAFDSNWITIYGTVLGRTISDSGKFTDCICKSFGDNVGRRRKNNFGVLMKEIGKISI